MANISKINFKGVEYDIKPLMDEAPTQGSTNAVQSGGVWSALQSQSAGLSEDAKAALTEDPVVGACVIIVTSFSDPFIGMVSGIALKYGLMFLGA